MEIEVFSDGGARGNPGLAAIGVVIKNKSGAALKRLGKFIGKNLTNNQAEYQGVIEGLRLAQKYQPRKITFFLDSQLLVQQLSGYFKVKNKDLKKYFDQVLSLKLAFPVVEFKHIPRKENWEADGLVNETLDKYELTQIFPKKP